ncbi:hypothetical protein NMY22_g20140 [Coprinellus aureogranulatus]|nr:hypothetical protein NMY22_g20140 [Coprinellus aureogranulatus]
MDDGGFLFLNRLALGLARLEESRRTLRPSLVTQLSEFLISVLPGDYPDFVSRSAPALVTPFSSGFSGSVRHRPSVSSQSAPVPKAKGAFHGASSPEP